MNQDSRSTTDAGKPRSLTARLIGEFRLFLALFLYLWVLFALFVLNQDITRREAGDSIALQGFAILNALVLGKIMLVAEHFDFARWLRRKPVIWSILFEAAFCSALFLGFHVIERAVSIWIRGSVSTESPFSFGGGGLLGLAIVVVILFVSLLPFFAFKNVARIIGEETMRRILFEGAGQRST
ncbi:hypothetical protein SAMN02745157_1554 [Kaistia soli DSM 19436]|uniref:Uncharacterized protein n=1 Tax=Kaistia soli DSM 19436 TaxID=1122133 RepID=A0A1M4YLX5_9HYPH|nr:hypothetical protein [Kaistia soli]SHF06522.1 hypothetical protein SAMN02745157_1554 [Kaistia soli DSM 19436]